MSKWTIVRLNLLFAPTFGPSCPSVIIELQVFQPEQKLVGNLNGITLALTVFLFGLQLPFYWLPSFQQFPCPFFRDICADKTWNLLTLLQKFD